MALGALGRPLWVWDSWVTWGMKARLIFLEGGITRALYADPSRLVTHPDYPLLLPLVQAWLFQWLGAADDRLAGAATLLAFVALLGICYAAVRRWGGSRTLALAVLVALGGGTVVAGLAGIAFADTPLALLVTIATLYLVEWLARGEGRALWIAALAGGLLPWCKREGLLLLGVLCVATLLLAEATGARGRGWRGVGALLLAGLLLAGPWWAFVAWAKVANSGDFAPLGWATLAANVGRAPTIARMMAQQLVSTQWNGLWLLAALGGLLRLGRRRGSVQSGDLLLWVAVGYLAAVTASYFFSTYEPYPQHIATSAFRLIAQVAPLPALWIARCALVKDEGAVPLSSGACALGETTGDRQRTSAPRAR